MSKPSTTRHWLAFEYGKKQEAKTEKKLILTIHNRKSQEGKAQKEVDQAKEKIQEATGCRDLVEEKTSLVEASYQNYEVLVEEQNVAKDGGIDPPKRYNTQEDQIRYEPILALAHNKKGKNKGGHYHRQVEQSKTKAGLQEREKTREREQKFYLYFHNWCCSP